MNLSTKLNHTPLNEAIIYTDGSCGKHGRSGWAALVASPSFSFIISGSEFKATAQRMELLAVVKALNELPFPHDITLVSDSSYVLKSIENGWYKRWIKNNETARKNYDLWVKISLLLKSHNVTPHKVAGHSGVKYNEWMDALCVNARKGQTPTIIQKFDHKQDKKEMLQEHAKLVKEKYGNL